MFCKNCGAEMKEEQKFCTSCGTKIVGRKIDIDNNNSNNQPSNTVVTKKSKSTAKIIIASVSILLVIAVTITSIMLFSPKYVASRMWNEYLQTHSVDNDATNITYQIYGQEALIVSDFSCDLDSEKIISSQFYDIDNDDEKLLQITIKKDKNTSNIIPCLEVSKNVNGSCSTETYNFNFANFYISTKFEGNYYLYKSDKSTYVLLEKDKPTESSQFYAAGIIDIYNSDYRSYSLTKYDNGVIDCYDIYNNKTYLTTDGDNADILIQAYDLQQMSYLRTLFSELGLKGFLTGTNDIDNIMDYNDIMPIGKFSVTFTENQDHIQGHITYTDLINKGE